jgi:hypothetical protein
MITHHLHRCLITGLAGMVFLSSCSTNVREKGPQPTSGLMKKISPANPSAYDAVQDASEWRNPFLLVRRDGIEVRSGNASNAGVTMAVTEVMGYLERLSAAAWPYGLVVAVEEIGIRSVGDDIPIKRNREQLIRLLEAAGVRVDPWPSA